MFRTTDGGQSWQELPGLRGHGTGSRWTPGAGGMCLHTILLDPQQSRSDLHRHLGCRRFRTDDAGKTWKPINRGLRSQYIPDPTAEVGPLRAPHRHAPSRPNVLFMQKHWDVMRSDNAGDNWHEVSGNLPTDFGFVIDVHAHEPETIYVVPIKSDSEHFPLEGKLRVYRSRTGGNDWEPLTKGLPQSDCYVNVLRDAMAVDSLDHAACISARRADRCMLAGRRRQLVAHRPRSSGGHVRRSADAVMTFEWSFRYICGRWRASAAKCSFRSTIRSRSARCSTRSKRLSDAPRHNPRPRDAKASAAPAFLRLRAGSLHESPDAPLPEAVATGAEPFVVIGAIAGG